jgi:N-acetylglucosaminyldiphosphoundecaprenol N-acetyl-beta-D-mannosaminyltransferase
LFAQIICKKALMEPVPKFNVLGVAMSAMNLDLATRAVLAACAERRKGYVCVTGVHGVSEAQRDVGFRKILNGAFLNTCDGMPLVWEGRRALGPEVDRVYGPDLMLRIMDATRDGRFSHYFYGGASGVADHLKAALEQRFPGVKIVGTHCPPFRPLTAEEDLALAVDVAAKRPDMMWIGLSTPKQERFMAEYLPRLETTLMFGVGAAFDFHTGRMREAPRWMMRSGLQWLHRLSSDPRRLWKRYGVIVPTYLARIFLQRTGLRKYPLDPVSAPPPSAP